ncbi:YybH family protein [Herminiimonas aquatilis]|uniref:YybH family protein n=1 Tax=Herminiimonas aquatilis TaxID=345342 RepID=A0ABW2J9T8_9BURK
MDQAVVNIKAETDIRNLIKSWEKAASAGNLDAIMSHYSPEVIAYDAIAALQFKGAEAYKKHWKMCLEMCSGPMTFTMHDLHIGTADEIAYSHYLNHCGGSDKDGNQHSSWMRVSSAYRKINGQWRIVHEHFSAPFDPESGKALFDLKP